MRRSSSGSSSRLSLVPQRIKNDAGSAVKPRGSLIALGASASTLCNRLSYSGRPSVNDKKSTRLSSSSSASGLPVPKKRCSVSVRSYNHTGIVKDPRPISNRAFRDQLIRQLIQFLVEHSYPYPISPKILHSPKTKDFTCIFEFLLGCLLPQYKLTKRIEEEVPRILKLLAYPFTITKSAMCSVSSPLTWPTLLAALSWIQQLIDYARQFNVDEIMFHSTGDDFCVSETRILFAYCENSYREFLDGADSYTDLEEELANQLIGAPEGGSANSEELEQEHRILTEQLDRLGNQPNELLELRQENATLDQDLNKLNLYASELVTQQRQQADEAAQLDIELEALHAELNEESSKVTQKQEILERQPISAGDAEKLRFARQDTLRQTELVDKQHADADAEIWHAEMNIAKTHEKLELVCSQYMKKAQQLRLVPGVELEDLHLRAAMSDSDRFNIVVKPALMKLKTQSLTDGHALREEKLEEEDKLEQEKDTEKEQADVLKQLENQLKRIETNIENKKEVIQKEYESLHQKLESIRDEHLHYADLPNCLKDAKTALQETKQRVQSAEAARQKEASDYLDMMMEASQLVTEHKRMMKEQVSRVQKHLHVRSSEELHSAAGTTNTPRRPNASVSLAPTPRAHSVTAMDTQ